MDPETLVSFAFRAPKTVRTVELLGSWDNFQRPYAMYHDRRRGSGFYTGCFQFQDIVFDGSEVDWTKPRTGGLKQGGTYWYYFRLDDGVEAYDDLRECTASCPLMPGQMVNVMYVPREVPQSPVMKRSASVSLVGTLSQLSSLQTMNPQAKFQAPQPPPVSKVHDRCISDFALSGRLEGQPPSPKEDLPTPPPSEEGLLKAGRRMFGSVGSLHKRGMSLTGSLRNMAGRAAMRARVRQEATTYEASLINEESASIHPPRSVHDESARPQTRRALADLTIPDTNFKGFSQVVAIPTPAASPTKLIHDSDTASIGPQSICDIQFLSTSPPQEPLLRTYSLHNPDQHVSTIEPQPTSQTLDQPSPALAVASPTFSDATVSTTDGGDMIGTPSLEDALATPYVDIKDEDVAAQLRWGHTIQTCNLSQQNYRLPRDSVLWPSTERKPTPSDLASGPTERSGLDAIFTELGYLGDSIH